MNQSDTEIEAIAEKIALSARERSAEIDRDRRLPDELVARLAEAGLLRATMPREVRALELPPGPALRCAEAVARGDASAGWCVSIAITSALLVAYLPASSRDEMFGDGRGVAAGVWAPRGTARSVDGGVVVSGRWPFCSGINHADMMFAGCFVDEKRVPSVVALHKDDLQVLDTWHTLGLRGTGSHDSLADDVFVPADRVFSVFDGPAIDRPLYRFPVFGFFALSIGAAALGNARAAIGDLVELAGGKKGLGATRTLAQRPATQAAVATAESALGAARALYYEAIDEAWRASQQPEPVPVAMRNRLRLAATHSVRTSADVVRTMYDLAGGTAIYDGAPLQRRFRDAFTVTAHFQVNEASRELPGRVLLDQPADVSML
ncbi:Flavin-dependent monooxygenase, oxygenase subunit HsaA [Mycobacterium simulans]|uniref:Flavin-dependent monooxygenase, oxygenase subunit HsaA n=1 Tax=Mycobacterium simulans TaxID=627089 RepID=A0A7Z7II71_9MYCO|nr:acyl-CoA dehydrogenase family protein [Mycobacterium simulans]SOJ54007.1 Flavin-dependent monooxygenase, oxygenase subunit HsaA [Mycobacterium simulans]